MTLLTPTQASEIVGVPAVQLQRWAYLGQGPRNSGTKHKPMFDEDDLREWLEGYRATTTPSHPLWKNADGSA
jgi:hypothetical protein